MKIAKKIRTAKTRIFRYRSPRAKVSYPNDTRLMLKATHDIPSPSTLWSKNVSASTQHRYTACTPHKNQSRQTLASMNDRPPAQGIRLGMVAWHALPAILPRLGTAIGGLETGAWTLARGLSAFTSVRPYFFVRSTQLSIPKMVDGVRLIPDRQLLSNIRRQVSDAVDVGPPFRIRRFRPRLLWQLPLLAAARWSKMDVPAPSLPDPRLTGMSLDAWAGFGVNADSARVAATAAAQRRPMILFLESNADLDPKIALDEESMNSYGESSHVQRFALQHASVIVCQSEFQQRQLKTIFARDGLLLRNPIDQSQWQVHPQCERKHVLWIGRYDTFHKRPALALEIASRLPELRFRMIVNRHDPDVEAMVRRTATANVEIVDYVPFDQMAQQFASARAFLCTGSPAFEGFPNVLLQSAAAHTPIVSLSDFDDFLQRSQAGRTAEESIEAAVSVLHNACQNDVTPWQQVDDYLDRFHSLRAISHQAADAIRNVCGAPS
jgi:hypothetical protein